MRLYVRYYGSLEYGPPRSERHRFCTTSGTYLDVGHHSTPFLVCNYYSTSGKIQHGGGRHLEFLFIQAISPDRYQVVQYVIRREITRGRDSDIASHLQGQFGA